MAGIIVAWTFFSFIFFKVIIDVGMDSDITVLAALLMSIVFGGVIFFSSDVYAMRLFYINASPGSNCASLGEIIKKTIWPFFLFCAGFIISSRLIVWGFSKRLDREFSGWNAEEEFLWFCIFISVPLVAHYTMVLFPTYQNAKKPDESSDSERQTTNLHFKSGEGFFEYQCKFGFTDIEKIKLLRQSYWIPKKSFKPFIRLRWKKMVGKLQF